MFEYSIHSWLLSGNLLTNPVSGGRWLVTMGPKIKIANQYGRGNNPLSNFHY